ncbi:hypothetical protein BLOT_015917 [Blomia tropicalis]|nr:hypothetical protein BLOT_015917 [Blomia tropicalis]
MNHSTFLIGDTVYENTQSSFLKYSYMVDDSNKQSVSTQSLYKLGESGLHLTHVLEEEDRKWINHIVNIFGFTSISDTVHENTQSSFLKYSYMVDDSNKQSVSTQKEKDRKWINHIVNIFGYTSIIVFVFLIVVIVVIIYISRKHYKDAINIKQNLSKFGSKFNLHIDNLISIPPEGIGCFSESGSAQLPFSSTPGYGGGKEVVELLNWQLTFERVPPLDRVAIVGTAGKLRCERLKTAAGTAQQSQKTRYSTRMVKLFRAFDKCPESLRRKPSLSRMSLSSASYKFGLDKCRRDSIISG